MPITLRKNRQRAFWSLVIAFCGLAVSGLFLFLGLQSGRPGVGWTMVLFGLLGLVAFGGFAAMVIRTMRSPWHLTVNPSHLALYTPTYDLKVRWERVAGIAVAEVNRRPGCVLVFDDVTAVVQSATFHGVPAPPDAVTNATRMQARMQENLKAGGYHLGIPGRILELGPEALAELLTRGRTGELWQEKSS